MKNLLSIIFFAATIAASCKNEPKKTTDATTTVDTAKTVENKPTTPAAACYSYIKDKDTVTLKMESSANVVSGKLSYKLYQKDSNKGELNGQLNGDTLLADYKFISEGQLSTRQVIFLIKNNVAKEGYGKMEEKNGKMVFKDMKSISFETGVALNKVECGGY
jgi:hypothetical protein